jgi:2-polyprenyl-6-hydroxyphenyl methylase / 3-demethylubiquinone-9 3-methyltransferase
MSNFDTVELNKFGELAHKWWDKNSEFKPLHDINPLRLNYINNISPLQGKTVLDVGCGGGILSESMAEKGAHVTGIDLGEKALSVAKLHSLESGLDVDYHLISAEEYAVKNPAKYDVITCLEMLEHVPNPESIIRACASLLKPNGHVFFSTINRNPKAYLMAVIGAEYLLKMLPKGTHEYQKFIKPSELAGWIRHTDMSLTNQIGMSYNPITKHYWLGNDVSVNYMVHAIKNP